MNKPVAWMVQYKGKHDFTFYKPVSHDDAVVIPLYTHPVKELTDEEIEIIADAFGVDNGNYYEFTKGSFTQAVKAILRKAQENERK